MKKIYQAVLVAGALVSIGFARPALADAGDPTKLYDLNCRSFNGDWDVLVYRDAQFGGVQVTGSASDENGAPTDVYFSFAATLTQQESGFTLTSDLENKDGSFDQFTISGARAHLSVEVLEDFRTGKGTGPVNQDLVCGE